MRCCKKGYRVMAELQKKELVYDISNTAYSFADSQRRNGMELHTLHNVFDISEQGNRDKLARILDSAVEDCRELLFRYTKKELRSSGFDSDDWEECAGSPTSEEDCYYLQMAVPVGFSETSVHTMTVYIHDYIVNRALYEWLMVVYPDGAERFLTLAQDKARKIKEASNRTAGRSRIRLHPF